MWACTLCGPAWHLLEEVGGEGGDKDVVVEEEHACATHGRRCEKV